MKYNVVSLNDPKWLVHVVKIQYFFYFVNSNAARNLLLKYLFYSD